MGFFQGLLTIVVYVPGNEMELRSGLGGTSEGVNRTLCTGLRITP